MEITIGVQNLPRELVLESDQSADEIAALVSAALKGASTLELLDSRGRRVFVPSAAIGFVEVGSEEQRKVGFGTTL